MAKILDGLKVSKEIKQEIRSDVEKIVAGKRRAPHLVAILVGSNGASMTYVNNKIKDCREVGFKSSLVKFPSTVSEAELLEKIEELNKSKDVDGFIVQLPLPKQIDQEKIIMAIDPRKDVDGFHPANFGFPFLWYISRFLRINFCVSLDIPISFHDLPLFQGLCPLGKYP